MKKGLKIASLFAGIGGFELGFLSVGIETKLICEIDKTARYVLKNNFPSAKIVGDICKLKQLPSNIDILCAGFPCQDISTIGGKIGLKGKRSSLVNEVFRLLTTKTVEWVIFENVPNMLYLNNGETIRTIITNLEKLGYKWAYRTIDSLSFVPQKRKRVFVVGSLSHDPTDVILSDSFNVCPGEVKMKKFMKPLGFYWTEGKYALGLYQDAIPTLKVGSSIGISSPPAIAFPNGFIGTPDIRDAERIQGFPEDWTKSSENIANPSVRWKMVGNAVTVDVVSFIAKKILYPKKYNKKKDVEVKRIKKFPKAGWGFDGKFYSSSSSMYPKKTNGISLRNYIKYDCKPLSIKAAKGFKKRLDLGKVSCPTYFKLAIQKYIADKGE